MKVYFRVDGDSNSGLGHLIRSFALAQMLQNDFSIVFVCIIVPNKIKENFTKNNFELINNEDTFFNTLKVNDVVVLDGYHFDIDYQIKIKKKGAFLICIDDLHDQKFVADIVINHSLDIEPSFYDGLPDTKYLLGTDYVLLRRSFLNGTRKNKEENTVFICFGGSDLKNLTLRALKTVVKFNEFAKIYVITGEAYPYTDILDSYVLDSDNRIQHYSAVDEEKMAELMLVSKIAIVPCSGVLIEALAMGCVPISGMYVDNQKNIYNSFLRLKYFIDAKSFDKFYLENAIKKALNKNFVFENVIDQKSGERILYEVKNMILQKKLAFRDVTIEDAELLFNWANDLDVRRNAVNQETIIWENHINWLKSKIKSKESIVFILEISNKPVGQIRIDLIDGFWFIDYSIDKKRRGLGLGRLIVKLLLEKMNNYKYKAIVKKENISSIKVFESLGFVRIDNDDYYYTFMF